MRTTTLLPLLAAAMTASGFSADQTSASPVAMQTPAKPPVQATEKTSFNSVHVDQPVIALTFDDGPHATLTPRLLDILKQRNIKVTFFVLGQNVQALPDIVKRELAEGHEIANHTWDHKPLNRLPEGGLDHEIKDTSAEITSVTGQQVTLLRPPYGATNPRLNKAIEKQYGLKVIIWSVDPDDWKDPGPQIVSSRILNGWKESGGVKPGAIILCHDIHKGTVEAMPATLDALIAKGYKFVTVSELLAMEKPKPSSSPAEASPQAVPAQPSQG